MDVLNSDVVGGSLQISTDVIAKIARQACLEVEGVHEVAAGSAGVKNLWGKTGQQHAVTVELTDDVAEITVCIVVAYGCKIPSLCEKVQKNVKSSVQNMTDITVSRVNVTVVGICQDLTEAPGEE